MNLLQEVHNGNIDRIKDIINQSGVPSDEKWSDYILLRYALWRGHRDIATLLIQKGCRVNKMSKSSSNTPLHIAVKQEDIEIVNLLLEKGAMVDSLNHNAQTPLHFAAQTKNDKIINMILEKVDITESGNLINKRGLLPLHIACIRNDKKAVEKLLELNVKINEPVVLSSPFWPSYTPLHFAVEYDRTEIVELLLSKNADICSKDSKGLTPLHLAVVTKNKDIIDLILCAHSNYDRNVNPEDENGFTHFHAACMRNNPSVVEGFLQRGVEINRTVKVGSTEWSGYTPLHIAVENDCTEIVELLLRYGANICLKNSKGLTALHVAVEKKNEKIIDLILLAHSPNDMKFNPKDERDFSHFHAACMRNNANVVEGFIQNGVDINSQVQLSSPAWANYTPLHFAVEKKCVEIVELLLTHGADLGAQEAKDLTPLHLATIDLQEKIMELLLNRGADVNAKTKSGMTPLHLAVERGYYDHVLILLNHNADVNCTDNLKLSTPLHSATLYKHFNIIDLLLSKGANVNARERDGKTALHTMALRNPKRELDMELVDFYSKMITSLINYGCDVDCQDTYGRTPLHMTCLYRNLPGAYALLQHGADINIEDGLGKTPLLYCMHVYHKIYYIFQDHIEKLRKINFPVSLKNESCYFKLRGSYRRVKRKWKDVDHDDEFSQRCTDELNRMKSLKVDNYSSLYNIIYKDANDMALHVSNDSLKEMINSSEFDKNFALYGYLIKLQFKKGLARQVLMKPAKESLEFLCGRGLPDSCSETILKNLSNDELNVLINVKS